MKNVCQNCKKGKKNIDPLVLQMVLNLFAINDDFLVGNVCLLFLLLFMSIFVAFLCYGHISDVI